MNPVSLINVTINTIKRVGDQVLRGQVSLELKDNSEVATDGQHWLVSDSWIWSDSVTGGSGVVTVTDPESLVTIDKSVVLTNEFVLEVSGSNIDNYSSTYEAIPEVIFK